MTDATTATCRVCGRAPDDPPESSPIVAPENWNPDAGEHWTCGPMGASPTCCVGPPSLDADGVPVWLVRHRAAGLPDPTNLGDDDEGRRILRVLDERDRAECRNGHNKDEPTDDGWPGRMPDGECRRCVREANPDRSQPEPGDQPSGAKPVDSDGAANAVDSDCAIDGESIASAPSRWACPEHGNADVVILTSRRGRVYGACKLCDEFDDGLTPEQRAQKEAEAERRWEERQQREERQQAERQAQLLADQRAPTCAHCGRIERHHSGEPHVFAGGTLAHATSGLIQAALVVGVIVAAWLFWVSATTPEAPFHSLTGPLLCFWDWKGTACQ